MLEGHAGSLRLQGGRRTAIGGARIALATGLSIAGLSLGACGGDESPSPPPTTSTTAGETAPVAKSDEPGAPDEGEPDYAGLGTWWMKLPKQERVASAADFITDNPAECAGVEAARLDQQTLIAYGYDFPETTPAGVVMLETCALISAD